MYLIIFDVSKNTTQKETTEKGKPGLGKLRNDD